ncbi:MAG: hypothetical protein ACLR4Z_15245 [Butyricicoccaceae bacterium]
MRRLPFAAVLLVAALSLLPVLWPQDISHESAEGAAETPTAPKNETVTVQIDGKPTRAYARKRMQRASPPRRSRQIFRVRRSRAARASPHELAALCQLSTADARTPNPEADLCDDYRHCAAYRSPAVSVFGTDEISAIRAAVRDTEGEILTSEGAPIAAVFHCVSGPRTESAADVWGEDRPLPAKAWSVPAARPLTATRALSLFQQTISAKRPAPPSLPPIFPARPPPGSRPRSARTPAASKP